MEVNILYHLEDRLHKLMKTNQYQRAVKKVKREDSSEVITEKEYYDHAEICWQCDWQTRLKCWYQICCDKWKLVLKITKCEEKKW